MKFIFKIYLIAACLLFLGSCQKKEESISDQESQTQKAIQLTEQGRFEEALSILHRESEKNPSERLQVLKASVYAARAGIKVENYWGFVVGYESLLGPAETPTQDALGDLPEVARGPLKGLKNELAILKMVSRRIEKIPTVTDAQRADLLLAQEALQETQSAGARLYRGVLGIIILKASILEASTVIAESAEAIKTPCAKNWDLGIQWLRFNYEILHGILQDLQVAFPSQKSAIAQIQSQIQMKDISLERVCPK